MNALWRSSLSLSLSLSLFQSFRRRAHGDIFAFRILFRNMIHDLAVDGMPFRHDMVFLRDIQALVSDESQRLDVVAASSSSSTPKFPTTLRKITHKLPAQPFGGGKCVYGDIHHLPRRGSKRLLYRSEEIKQSWLRTCICPRSAQIYEY